MMESRLSFSSWIKSLKEPLDAVRKPHRTYREVFARIESMIRLFPEVVQADLFGFSVLGHPLWCVEVVHPGCLPDGVLILANLHAMEHVGVEVCLTLIQHAASGGGGWRKRPLCVVPVANPDGFLAVEEALAEGKRFFLRKNRNGVDLNRNFSVHFDPDSFLNRFFKAFFHPGAGPLSEPETRALDSLAGRVRPGFVASLHAFGEWIYFPYAGSRRRAPDHRAMYEIAREMAARQPYKRYRVMQLGRRSRFFLARGAEIDHFYEKHGAFSFLMEIGSGPSLGSPHGWLSPYRWFTPEPARLNKDVANVLSALDYLSEAAPPGGIGTSGSGR